jgi:hypothetical protein
MMCHTSVTETDGEGFSPEPYRVEGTHKDASQKAYNTTGVIAIAVNSVELSPKKKPSCTCEKSFSHA